MKNIKVQLLIVFVLFISVNFVSYFKQDRISVNNGKDYDGLNYYDMAERFSQGKELKGPAPYIYRIGTPFLASLIDTGNLIQSFFIVNLIANFISCFLLFWYLKLFIKNFSIILALLILYLTHWLCVTRFIYYAPVNTDPWSMVFFLLGLLLLEKIKKDDSLNNILSLSLVSIIGVLFREYLLLIPISLLFIHNPFSRKNFIDINFKKIFYHRLKYFIPLSCGILGIIFTHLITINEDPEYLFIKTAARWLYNKTLVHYLRSVFIVFGPAIVLLLFFHKRVLNFLKRNQHILVISFAGIVLSFVGGTDTERFLIWVFPVMLLLIGLIIENNFSLVTKISFLLPLIVTQSISDRIFLNTPQPGSGGFQFPVLTQIRYGDFFNLTSIYANKLFGFISLAEYCLLTGVLFMILRYYYFKRGKFLSTQ